MQLENFPIFFPSLSLSDTCKVSLLFLLQGEPQQRLVRDGEKFKVEPFVSWAKWN